MTPAEHVVQRNLVAASMLVPVYADRVSVPREPMSPAAAAAAFLVSAAHASQEPTSFRVDRRVA